MKIIRSRFYVLLFIVFLIFLVGCSSAPYTNRKQFIYTSEAEEIDLRVQAWRVVKSKNKIDTNTSLNSEVHIVGMAIAKVGDKSNYKWEYCG